LAISWRKAGRPLMASSHLLESSYVMTISMPCETAVAAFLLAV
jgi:hypothetical protein